MKVQSGIDPYHVTRLHTNVQIGKVHSVQFVPFTTCTFAELRK